MSFHSGQVVYVKKLKDIGLIIDESKTHPNNWIVKLRNKEEENINICIIPEKEISAYTHQCWNCHSTVNSSISETCKTCGWIKCPNCGSCRKSLCESDGVNIYTNFEELKHRLKNKPIVIDLEKLGIEFDDDFDIDDIVVINKK